MRSVRLARWNSISSRSLEKGQHTHQHANMKADEDADPHQERGGIDHKLLADQDWVQQGASRCTAAASLGFEKDADLP